MLSLVLALCPTGHCWTLIQSDREKKILIRKWKIFSSLADSNHIASSSSLKKGSRSLSSLSIGTLEKWGSAAQITFLV